MKVIDFKRPIYSNNHKLEYAKQGYVNMLTRPSNQHYYNNLYEARQKIIMESNLYSSLHKKVSEIIGKHLDVFHYPTIIFDAGSGEGSHLQKIINECRDRAITGIGLDIAKEGIIMASKNYHNPILL